MCYIMELWISKCCSYCWCRRSDHSIFNELPTQKVLLIMIIKMVYY